MYKKKEKKLKSIIYIILTLSMICFVVVDISMYNIHQQKLGYYAGRIKSMNCVNGTTTVEISPVASKRKYISEIKENHQINYKADRINIAALKDPSSKNFKKLKMGELRKTVKGFNVGDIIIFKVDHYDKTKYNLEVKELVVDLTLD